MLKWERIDSQTHAELMRAIIEKGSCPSRTDLAQKLGCSLSVVDDSLVRLSENHALLLHPGTLDVWVIHPFSLSPTSTWVQTKGRGWWAPCLWCAFGIVALIGSDAIVHARLGGEANPVQFRFQNSTLAEGEEYLIHFSIPPRAAWKNVHHFCACVQPFSARDEIREWCKNHGLPQGESISAGTLFELARAWYGKHQDPDWVKWSVPEAQKIFSAVGLTGDFWSLGSGTGRY